MKDAAGPSWHSSGDRRKAGVWANEIRLVDIFGLAKPLRSLLITK